MGGATRHIWISVEDYLEGEKTAEVRHEYVDGEVFAMVGTTKVHNLVGGNFYALLRIALAGRPCRVFMSDVEVYVKTAISERFDYPDLHVEYEPFTKDSYYSEHPKPIVEILSDSTERNDRSDMGGYGPKDVDVYLSDEKHGLLLTSGVKGLVFDPRKNLKNRSTAIW